VLGIDRFFILAAYHIAFNTAPYQPADHETGVRAENHSCK